MRRHLPARICLQAILLPAFRKSAGWATALAAITDARS
jgi:hypothetical protein